MLANKHPVYHNEYPYFYDVSRVLHVTEIYLQLNRAERSYQKCDLCQQTIRFPLLLPCPSLHLLCTECVFPQIFSQNLCRRPPLRYCPMCWPHYPINPDFFDRLQSPVEHNTTFDWPYKTHGARANAELDRRSLAFRRQRLARRLQAEEAAAADGGRQLHLLNQLRDLAPAAAVATSPFAAPLPAAAGGGGERREGGVAGAAATTAGVAAAVDDWGRSTTHEAAADDATPTATPGRSFVCRSLLQTAGPPCGSSSSSSRSYRDISSSADRHSRSNFFDDSCCSISSRSSSSGAHGVFGKVRALQRGSESVGRVQDGDSAIGRLFEITQSSARDAYEAEKARVSPLAVEIVRRWFPEPSSGTVSPVSAVDEQRIRRFRETRQQDTPPGRVVRQERFQPPFSSRHSSPFLNERGGSPGHSRLPQTPRPEASLFFKTAVAHSPTSASPSPLPFSFQPLQATRRQETATVPHCIIGSRTPVSCSSPVATKVFTQGRDGDGGDGNAFASHWSAMRARDLGLRADRVAGDRDGITCSYPRYIDVKDPFLYQFESEETTPSSGLLTAPSESSRLPWQRVSPLSPSAVAPSATAATSDGEILRLLLSQRSLATSSASIAGASSLPDFSSGGGLFPAAAGAGGSPTELGASPLSGRRGNTLLAPGETAEQPFERSQRAAAAARTRKENALLSLLLCGGVAASEVAAWAQEADIDEDDAIFFCSSKNVLVVRRILSIIHSGKYAQNNIPEHLLEPARRSSAVPAAATDSSCSSLGEAAAPPAGGGGAAAVKSVGFAAGGVARGAAAVTIGGETSRGDSAGGETRRRDTQHDSSGEGGAEQRRIWLPGKRREHPLRKEIAEGDKNEDKEEEDRQATEEDRRAACRERKEDEDGRQGGWRNEEEAQKGEKRIAKKRVGFQFDCEHVTAENSAQGGDAPETGTPKKARRLRWTEEEEVGERREGGDPVSAQPHSRRVLFALPEASRETPSWPQQQQQGDKETETAAQQGVAASSRLPSTNLPRSILKVAPRKSKTQLIPRCPKIIVASSLWESLFLLGCFLEKHNVRCGHFYEKMHGKEGRDATIKRFQRDCSTTVLLLSTNLGAHGLDLSCASHILLLDPPTDMNVEHQVISRAHRMGALRDVHVEVFILKDTVEEAILRFRGSWTNPAESGRPTTTYGTGAVRKTGGSEYRQGESFGKFPGNPAADDCSEGVGGSRTFTCEGPRRPSAAPRNRRPNTTGATHTHIRKLRLGVPAHEEDISCREEDTYAVHTNDHRSGEKSDTVSGKSCQGFGKGCENEMDVRVKQLHPKSIMQKCQPDWHDMHEESIGLGEGLQRQTEYLLRTLRTIRRSEV